MARKTKSLCHVKGGIKMETKNENCDHSFCQIVDATTVLGTHLNVYSCTKCGLVDYGVEKIPEEKE